MVIVNLGQQNKDAAHLGWAISTAVLFLFSSILGLIFALLSHITLFMVSVARPEIDAREAVANALVSFLGNIPLVGDALTALAASLGLVSWLQPNLGIAAALIGFLIGVAVFWSRAGKVSAHLFLPMDRSIALPIIPAAGALEPLRPMLLDEPERRAMPWVEPREGARKDVWLKLANFALSAGGMFEYQLLLGGPGTGKTRMSMEFARRILAKKGESDFEALVLHGSDNRDVLMTTPQRLRSWWRVRVRGLDPLPDDIWHVGWFSPEALARSNGRLMIKGQLGHNLEQWRPTCPTLLLLDDPLHDDSAFVVETLNKNAASFRHRVRLLIVNQTVPGDLRFGRAHKAIAWQSHVHPPFSDPLILSANAPLSDAEIRLLAGQLPPKLAQPLLVDSGLHEFRMITRGNPLLVELGLAWVGAGKPLQQMTEESLLEDRTRRFLQAVKTAGFETGQGQLVDLLAMATIANGAPTTLPSGDDGDSVWTIFGVQRIDQQSAARLFPAETNIDLRAYLPALRPETIGTAFARMALADLPQMDRNRIIRTAWRANPLGTLRTLLRIDGGYKYRTDQEDPLMSAFSAIPMQSGLATLDLFRLLLHASCSVTPQDWEDRNYQLGASLMEDAIAVGHSLNGEDAAQAFALVVDLILADRSTRMLRGSNAGRMLIEMLQALDHDGRMFDSKVLDHLERWAACTLEVVDVFAPGWESQQNESLAEDTVARLQDMAQHSYGRGAELILFYLLREAADLQPSRPNYDILSASASFIVASELAMLGGPSSQWQELQEFFPQALARARPMPVLALSILTAFAGAMAVGDAGVKSEISSLAEEADGIEPILADDARSQMLLARLNRYIVFAMRSDLSLCSDAAERVKLIAMRFPDKPEIQREYAETLRTFAFGTSDTASCRQLAERVEAIAIRFPQHEDIQRILAETWGWVAVASKADQHLCLEMAERVQEIGSRFPDNIDIQMANSETLCSVIYSSTSNTRLCHQLALRVEDIAHRFPLDARIQGEHAKAWCGVTYATVFEPKMCRDMAGRVAVIARAFPDEENIQWRNAETWCWVTAATTSNPTLCREMADRVYATAARFPNHAGIQWEYAKALSVVASATTDSLDLCRKLAERVSAIALRFPDHEGIQSAHVAVFRAAAVSATSDTLMCREFAEKVEAIALRFPDHEGIQTDHSAVWCIATLATSSQPELCRAMAQRVEAVALRFPDHEGIQTMHAEAWYFVTSATKADPDLCRQMAERVKAIALRFPQNRIIQDHARLAVGQLSLDGG